MLQPQEKTNKALSMRPPWEFRPSRMTRNNGKTCQGQQKRYKSVDVPEQETIPDATTAERDAIKEVKAAVLAAPEDAEGTDTVKEAAGGTDNTDEITVKASNTLQKEQRRLVDRTHTKNQYRVCIKGMMPQ